MKIQRTFPPLLAFLLFFSIASLAKAQPNTQNPQDDLVQQVLIATAAELGWNQSVDFTVTKGGLPHWEIGDKTSDAGTIQVYAYDSISDSEDQINGWRSLASSSSEYTLFTFHDHLAVSWFAGWGHAVFQVDQYNVWAYGKTVPEALDILEVFYANAETYGLITEKSSASTPVIPETEVPAIPTSAPGSNITLKAEAENFGTDIQSIENSDNLSSINISGRVTRQDNGGAVGGATITILSGAASLSTTSAGDGSYSLTVSVPGGQGNGQVSGVDFVLPIQADLSIEVTSTQVELLADGKSTSDITILVKDSQGKPLKDRVINLDVSADVKPGAIQPMQATTDEAGLIHANYTAFKLEPGADYNNPRHEVTISAKDAATGITSTNTIYVDQYVLSVLFGEYIPACTRCSFPSKFSISLTDYWNNPIPNTPVSLSLGGSGSSGTLVSAPDSSDNQQALTLITDANGMASAYYRWTGPIDINEAVQQAAILEETTNASTIKEIKIQGLDIAISRVEEAGFTGVTGQNAFLKVYFIDRAHPELPLDRFNADAANKLGLKVSIGQYHSDGLLTSVTYENSGGWDQDAKGSYVKMFATPYMPYITPVNDGTSWYEVRLDPVVDRDVYLPDLFRDNNDTIIALTTGSPDGWLHIWLQDGILTPHTWTGMVFKCVGRFLPVLGDAMTVIDTLNQVYNQDALGLGQSTAAVLTENLQAKGTPGLLTKYKASSINNVISCLQDSWVIYKENKTQGSFQSGLVCALMPFYPEISIPQLYTEEIDQETLTAVQDRFIQGVLLDSPDQRGVVVNGVNANNVILSNSSGAELQDSNRVSTGDNIVVYILPVNEVFNLELVSDHDFSIGIYEPGSDQTIRITTHHNVQTTTDLKAGMKIGGSSNYDFEIDYSSDGSTDTVLSAQTTILDVLKPEITALQPEDNESVSKSQVMITASYADNPGGSGIDSQANRIFIDGVDLTSKATIQSDTLSLSLSEIEEGEHDIRLVVSDLDGNAKILESTFNVQNAASLQKSNILLIAAGGGALFIIILGVIIASSSIKKRRAQKTESFMPSVLYTAQTEPVQDQQGYWWYLDGGSGTWMLWNGQAWQPMPGVAPQVADQRSYSTPPEQLPQTRPTSRSCLFTLATVLLLGLLAAGSVSLVALKIISAVGIQAGQGDTTVILKQGGGGLLLAVLGIFLLNGGFKAIINRRALVKDEFTRRQEKRGCGSVLYGFGQLIFGIACFAGGVGLITLVFYQQVLPWLGF